MNPALSTVLKTSSAVISSDSTVRILSSLCKSTDQDSILGSAFNIGVTFAKQLPQLMLVLEDWKILGLENYWLKGGKVFML